MARKTKTLKERFETKVFQHEDGCWYWRGYVTKNGFGQINLGPRGTGVDYAHRVSHTLFVGPISEKQNVIQTCGNRLCVNPEHLYLSKSRVDHTCTDVKERLLSRIIVNKNGCWEYQGFKTCLGYGRMGWGPRELGVEYVHRISWEIHNGEIPLNLFVLHKCDNPACVNPDHLFLGSQNDNIQDAIDKGRMWYQQ